MGESFAATDEGPQQGKTDPKPPYPGLRAFRRDEADLFYGRDKEVGSILQLLTAHRLVAVLGPSGSGKSSLVRTQVFGALEGGLSRLGSKWQIVDVHPGEAPFARLARGLVGAGALGSLGPEAADVETRLRRGPLSLAEWCEAGNLADGHRLVLLVDQFEELFNYRRADSREETQAFAALLVESARTERSEAARRIYVVITMRSEFFGACGVYPELADALSRSMFLTPRMSLDDCQDAIELPAEGRGFAVAKDLVIRLLNDMETFTAVGGARVDEPVQAGRQSDRLPLMQYALNRMWCRALTRVGSTSGELELTLADYEAIGYLEGALDAHGDDVIKSPAITEVADVVIGRIFRVLMRGPTVTLATRDPHSVAQIAAISGADIDTVIRVVEAFSADDCQFLLADRPIGPQTYVDITHESLIRQWSRLSAWLREEIESVATWTELARSTQAWEGTDRSDDELVRGGLLTRFQQWWDRERPTVAWAERYAPLTSGRTEPVSLHRARSFLDQCKARQERVALADRRLRRQARIGVAAAVGIAGLAALAVAFAQTIDAQHSRALTREAVAQRRRADGSASAAAEAANAAASALTLVAAKDATLQASLQRESAEKKAAVANLHALLRLIQSRENQLAIEADSPQTAVALTRDEADQIAHLLKGLAPSTPSRSPPRPCRREPGKPAPAPQPKAMIRDDGLVQRLVELEQMAAEASADSVGANYDPDDAKAFIRAKIGDITEQRRLDPSCNLVRGSLVTVCAAALTLSGRVAELDLQYPLAAKQYAAAASLLRRRTDAYSEIVAFKAATRLIGLHMIVADDPRLLAETLSVADWCAAEPAVAPPDDVFLRLIQCRLAVAEMKLDQGDKGAQAFLDEIRHALYSRKLGRQGLSWARAIIELEALDPRDPQSFSRVSGLPPRPASPFRDPVPSLSTRTTAEPRPGTGLSGPADAKLQAAIKIADAHLSSNPGAEEAVALKFDSLGHQTYGMPDGRGNPDGALMNRLDYLNDFPAAFKHRPYLIRTLRWYLVLLDQTSANHEFDQIDKKTYGRDGNGAPFRPTEDMEYAINRVDYYEQRLALMGELGKYPFRSEIFRYNLPAFYDDNSLNVGKLRQKWRVFFNYHQDKARAIFFDAADNDNLITQLAVNGATNPAEELYLPDKELSRISYIARNVDYYYTVCGRWPDINQETRDMIQVCQHALDDIRGRLGPMINYRINIMVDKEINSASRFPVRPSFNGRDLVSYFDADRPSAIDGQAARATDGLLYGRVNLSSGFDLSPESSKGGPILLFSSIRNLEEFRSDQAKYFPIYNGFAADWLIYGELKPGNPELFCVLSSRIWLFSTELARNRWCQAQPLEIADLQHRAQSAWDAIPESEHAWGAAVEQKIVSPMQRAADRKDPNGFLAYDLKTGDHIFYPATGVLEYGGLDGFGEQQFSLYLVRHADNSLSALEIFGARIKDSSLGQMVTRGTPINLQDGDKPKVLRWYESNARQLKIDADLSQGLARPH